MYLKKETVKKIIEKAIINCDVLIVSYHHVDDTNTLRVSKKAPFDLGTTNPKYFERNKDNLYMFCYDHIDKDTRMRKPIVHPISSLHILKIEETDEKFNPIELTNINLRNTGYDYRKCKWALVPDRNWYK